MASVCKYSVFAILAACLGCGGGGDVPKLGSVTGTVKIDGQPAPNVMVNFTPVDGGRPSSGVTDSSGVYKLTYSSSDMGAVLGKHTVKIDNHVDYDMNAVGAPMEVKDGKVTKDYAKLKKEVEVKAGSNTIDLEYP